MLIIRNLTLYLLKDLRTLLDDFNFSLEKSQKVALIGEEGNGKSTLLKVIVDEDLVADYVKVTGEINKKGEIIGYLPQVMPDRDLSMTTLDYLNSHINMEEITILSSTNLPAVWAFHLNSCLPISLLKPFGWRKDQIPTALPDDEASNTSAAG